jgi:hypothetical protein
LLGLFAKKEAPTAPSNIPPGGIRAAISGPFNPVHVTHVGFNQETGEFTVRSTQLLLIKGSP